MSIRWRLHHLEQGDLRLPLLPGIGGRLWDVEFQGSSLLFQNPDLNGLTFDDPLPADLPTRSAQFSFPLWGGEKTWIAPDTSWENGAPFPALDSGSYEITSADDAHIEMVSGLCPLSQLAVTRRITLTSPNSWTIAHRVSNHGRHARLTGIWSVMMLDTPTKVGVATGAPAFQPVFGDAMGMVSTSETGVVANCARQQEFKIGLFNSTGSTLIRCGETGPWIICAVPPPEQGDTFAHHAPFEIFNSGDYPYCEAEWHSPARALAPNDTLAFTQTFQIWADGCAPQETAHHTISKELLSCMS